MDYPLLFWVAWVLSGGFTLLLGTAMVLYIRRTWLLLRAEEDGSIHERILDGLDQLETQVHLLNERMERMERRLPGPDGERPGEVPTEGGVGGFGDGSSSHELPATGPESAATPERTTVRERTPTPERTAPEEGREP